MLRPIVLVLHKIKHYSQFLVNNQRQVGGVIEDLRAHITIKNRESHPGFRAI